jgi:hypothetical protein
LIPAEADLLSHPLVARHREMTLFEDTLLTSLYICTFFQESSKHVHLPSIVREEIELFYAKLKVYIEEQKRVLLPCIQNNNRKYHNQYQSCREISARSPSSFFPVARKIMNRDGYQYRGHDLSWISNK